MTINDEIIKPIPHEIDFVIVNGPNQFPSTSVLDNFNRSENPLSTGWAGPTFNDYGAGHEVWIDMKANGTVAVHKDSPSVSSVAAGSYYTAAGSLANCEVYATATNNPGAGNWQGLSFRCDGDNSGYHFCFSIADGWTELGAVIDGVWQGNLLTGSPGAIASGDKVGVEAIEDKIKVYKDHGSGWVQIGSTITDSTFSSGYIGVNTLNGELDNFGGGAITTGGIVLFIIGGAPYSDPDFAPTDRYVEIDTPTTFIATGTTSEFVNYEWDFGDGTKGWGSEVVHTYNIPVDSVLVKITAHATDGDKITTARTVYIDSSDPPS